MHADVMYMPTQKQVNYEYLHATILRHLLSAECRRAAKNQETIKRKPV